MSATKRTVLENVSVEYREKQGGFQKKEDIMQVSGIGEKMYERMEEYLTVE